MGAPLEGLSAQQIRAHYGQVADYVDGARAWKKKPYRWRLPGLYSDDTQQALVLAEVLLNDERIDPDHVADLYLRLANPRGSYMGAHRGIGRSFRQVINSLEHGASPRHSGQTSAGIGAAMRIAPVALYYAGHPELLFQAVMDASLITHRDIRSLAGAMAVAFAVYRLSAGALRDPSFLLWLAADVARAEERIAAEFGDLVTSLDEHCHSISRAIAHAEAVIELPRDQAFAALVEEANRHGADPKVKRPTMGFPPACIPTCLYVLMTTESFREAAIEIINQGGDTDSTGAVLGAMAGTHYGIGSIPQPWLASLQNRDGIDLRAIALARRNAAGLRIPNLVETEHRLSDREEACRDRLLGFPQGGGDLGANRRF